MRSLLSLTLLAVLAVAACGPGASASPSGAAATPSAAASSAAPADSPSAAASASGSAEASGSGSAGEPLVTVADSEHGEILVDSEGRTLYMFVPDEATGEPTCYDQCAANWPPLVTE